MKYFDLIKLVVQTMKKRHRTNSVNRGAWRERIFDEKCNENNNYTKTPMHTEKRKTKTRRICLQRMWHINAEVFFYVCDVSEYKNTKVFFMYVTKWHFSCSIKEKNDACYIRVHHFGKLLGFIQVQLE